MRDATAKPRRRWLSSLAAGLVLALAALVAAPIAGLPIRWLPHSDAGEVTAVSLFAGVALTGWLLWSLLTGGGANWVRGGVTGVLVACLSYPVVLLLSEFGWISGPPTASLPERLDQVVALASFGLLTTGFAATVVLALAGMAIGAVRARLDPRRAAARPRGIFGVALQGLSFCAMAIVILLVAAFVALSLLPVPPLATGSAVAPSTSYAEAMVAFARLREDEARLPLHPRCGTSLLTHGEKVARVVIFLHGLTNCPAQADELAPFLFAAGYNVLVPRLPGHGEADPLTLALAEVIAEDFLSTAQTSLALAHGLGDEVIVVGLSAGGTVAAYQAQREPLAKAVPIAPFLAPSIVPGWAARAATSLLLLMPNKMVWWDPRHPYSSPEMDYAYPRFATHALGEIMRLGLVVAGEAQASAPAAPQIGLLLNDADLAVNNRLAESVAADWTRHGGDVTLRVLPQAAGLPHDLIDPRQPDAAIDVIYPLVLEMISSPRPEP